MDNFRGPGFDIIGDVHGCADELKELLRTMGYRPEGRGFRHPSRRAVFLGDYIDRGPKIHRSLEIVRSMLESGAALAISGNHEMNAAAWFAELPSGKPLRSHSPDHTRQFEDCLKQSRREGWDLAGWAEWFMKLPLWLSVRDGAGTELHFVHAVWDDRAMRRLLRAADKAGAPLLAGPADAPHFTAAGLVHSFDPESPWFALIDPIQHGIEVPVQGSFDDKDGKARARMRVRWWKCGGTVADMALMDSRSRSRLPAGRQPFDTSLFTPIPVTAPTFLGHYPLGTDEIAPMTESLACVDFSCSRGGALAAYRWNDGDSRIVGEQFVHVRSHQPDLRATPLERALGWLKKLL